VPALTRRRVLTAGVLGTVAAAAAACSRPFGRTPAGPNLPPGEDLVFGASLELTGSGAVAGMAFGSVVMGRMATQGRNKVTLIASPKVATLGYWVEQLIAESTGKEGKGIVPVEGEPVGKPAVYGDDRLFVYIRMDADPPNRAVQALEKAGHPVVTLTMRDKLDLGGEFFRWEVATAIAGAVLGIDAFDQPNVQESKDNTKKVLAIFKGKGKLPAAESVAASKARAGIKSLLGKAKRGSYFAIMAYTARTPGSEAAIAAIRTAVRDKTKIATTAGYGPRFLHSTGQLHKGGPKTGLFLQVVQNDAKDVSIPGQPYSFSVLKQAQAIGDLQSLTSRRLPVLRVTLGREPAAGWRALAAAVKRGHDVFQEKCSICHFDTSEAKKIGPGLKGLNKRGTFSVNGNKVTDENLKTWIENGDSLMPPFKEALEEAQIKDVIAYVKTL